MKKVIGLIAGLCLAVFAAFPVASDAGIMTLMGVGGGSAPALACSYTPVTTGTQGTAYTGATPVVTGGAGTKTFSTTGTYPTGLTTSTSTGVTSGTPTNSGTFTPLQLIVTDSISGSANCGSSFTLTIAAPGPPVLTFVGGTGSSSNSGSVATFTGVSIGTASGFTTRRIIVTILAPLPAASTMLSATIGGIAATIHVQAGGNNTPSSYVAVISADVPTGTTATIVLTYDNSLFNPQFGGVYTVDDALLVSTTPQVGSAINNVGVTSLTTSSFTAGSGGVIVAVNELNGGSTGAAISGYTTDLFGGSNSGTIAHLAPSSSGSTTATATWGTSQTAALAATAWR